MDPYKILGVSPQASDEEIKAAYKKLVRKYHPDRYHDDALVEMANQKMAQINAAYDKIMDDRKNGINSSYGSAAGTAYAGYGHMDSADASYTGTGYGQKRYTYQDVNIDYQEVRSMIQRGDLQAADVILSQVPDGMRPAEWYFLHGTICYKRGWLEEAYVNIVRATQMNPASMEYSQALQQMNLARAGYGTSRSSMAASDDVCNCMGNLCIADCCCEAMGGDLIPCC